jgi:peptidoglycan hydrolase-like protein with peptidoglycan-binding domain
VENRTHQADWKETDMQLKELLNIAAPVSLGSLPADQVKELQGALANLGYPVGDIDGLVGPRTRSAWSEFQNDVSKRDPTQVDTASVAALQQQLAKQAQPSNHDFSTRDGTIAAIIDECRRQGIGLRDQIAYVLATTQHETNNTFQPVREAYYMRDGGEAYRRTLRYYPYYGRGYVQLTWEQNYRTYGGLLDKDLVNSPDLALQPEVALFVLVHGFKVGTFTGRAITNYINASHTDFVNARRCINGLDRAQDIAAIATQYARTYL